MLTSTRPQGAVTPGMLTARIEGTMRLARDLANARTDPHAHAQARTARQALRNLASELTDATTGRVHGGYLSLSANGQALANTSRWASGNRSGAVEKVRDLIGKAYGARLQERGLPSSVDESINRYLARSGGKLGTKSLVGLVRELEKKYTAPATSWPRPRRRAHGLTPPQSAPPPSPKIPRSSCSA